MEVKLIAFGIAKDIMKGTTTGFSIDTPASILDLKNALTNKYPEFNKLQSLKFAINEDYQGDDYLLHEGDEVVIIPPVSGG